MVRFCSKECIRYKMKRHLKATYTELRSYKDVLVALVRAIDTKKLEP